MIFCFFTNHLINHNNLLRPNIFNNVNGHSSVPLIANMYAMVVRSIDRLNEFKSIIYTDGWPVNQPRYWPGNQLVFVVSFVCTYAGAPRKLRSWCDTFLPKYSEMQQMA